MPPGAGLGYLLGLLLIELPVTLIRDLWRLRQRWRAVPLPVKNQMRGAFGGGLVVLCIGAAVAGLPFVDRPPGLWALIGAASLGLLYLVGGVLGSRGARFDFFAALWWGVAVAGCLAGLLVLEGVIR